MLMDPVFETHHPHGHRRRGSGPAIRRLAARADDHLWPHSISPGEGRIADRARSIHRMAFPENQPPLVELPEGVKRWPDDGPHQFGPPFLTREVGEQVVADAQRPV